MLPRLSTTTRLASNLRCERTFCGQRIEDAPIRSSGRVFCDEECAAIFEITRDSRIPVDDTGWSWAPPTRKDA